MSSTRAAVVLAMLAGCGEEPCPPGSSRDPADGLCHLDDHGRGGDSAAPDMPTDDTAEPGGGDTGGGDDTGDPGHGLDLTTGDPITVLAESGDPGGPGGGDIVEWVDATPIGDAYVVMSGQGGARIYSLETGEPLGGRLGIPRTYRSDADGTDVVFGGRGGPLFRWTFADPTDPQPQPSLPVPNEWGYYEDIAFSHERVLLGFHDRGGQLLDGGGTPLATLEATDAYGVGLSEDRAVITDLDELVLFDISDPRNPAELDRVPMIGEGRDIDFDGTRIAVGLGGLGVGVWDIEADVLVERGTAFLPGSSLDVSVDGDEVWVGAWQETALIRVTDAGLITLGLESPRFSAMAVAAASGRAMVADWYGVQLLERARDVAGPELHIDETLRFQEGGQAVRAYVRNWGPEALTLEFSTPDEGFTVSPESVTVAPGGVESVAVTAPASLPGGPASAAWSSNDPDEPSGSLALAPADRGVGTEHVDFTLQGFTWPDSALQDFTLSEQRGKVVFLAYFALF